MHTFLTPEPIVCEIRNAAGEVVIELADVNTTSVDVVLSSHQQLGFLDDMLKAVNRWGNKSGTEAEDAITDDDATDRVKVEFRPATKSDNASENPSGESSSAAGRGVLIIDTDPARGVMRQGFVVRITAPNGSSVRARTESANVGITGDLDRLEVKSAAGNVNISQVNGSAKVQTASGDVNLSAVQGDLDLRVVSGRVEVGSVGGRAVVASTSGDVRLDSAGADVDIRTVSGDVEVRDVSAGTTEISGISGNLAVGVHQGTAARIDLKTMTGNARSDFDVADELDGATLNINAKTVSGNIRLRSAVSA